MKKIESISQLVKLLENNDYVQVVIYSRPAKFRYNIWKDGDQWSVFSFVDESEQTFTCASKLFEDMILAPIKSGVMYDDSDYND